MWEGWNERALKNLTDYGFPSYAVLHHNMRKQHNEVNKMSENNKPLRTDRAGAVSVSTFENENKNDKGETFKNVSFVVDKAYTKDDGKTWQHTNNFSLIDLAKLISKAQEAFNAEISRKKE